MFPINFFSHLRLVEDFVVTSNNEVDPLPHCRLSRECKSKFNVEISCHVLRQHDARLGVPGLDFDQRRRVGRLVAAVVACTLRHLLVLGDLVVVVVIIVSGARSIGRFAALRGRRQLDSLRLTHFMAEIVSHFIAKDSRLMRVIMVRHSVVATREAPTMRRRFMVVFY